MIRDDILWALNLTLLPLSLLAAGYSLRFQKYMAQKGYDDQPKGMLTLVRAISFSSCVFAIASALWMIWDLGYMTLSQTRDMGIIIRAMMLFSVFLICEFHHITMEKMESEQVKIPSIRDWFPALVMVYLISVYTVMVLI